MQTNKVSPVMLSIPNEVEIQQDLRCEKCQLILPCPCQTKLRRLTEVQLLEYELNEKQEIAAETVRGMARRRNSCGPETSSKTNISDNGDPSRTISTIMTDAEKMINDVDYSNTWFSRSKGKAKDMFNASADNKLALKLYGNKAAVVMEQKRQAQKGQGVIHPFSTFRWYWDIIMVVLITTHVLLLPVSIAFVETDVSPGWLTLNCVSDAIFIVDIVLNFRTGIIDFNRQEEVILDKEVIHRKYLHGWFIIDVLSSLPFDYIYIIASSGSSGGQSGIVQASRILRILKLTKLLSLLKLLRVSRIVRYIKELEELLNIQSGQMRIFKLIGCMLLLSHWNGCVQFLIPRLQGFPDTSWVVVNGLKDKTKFQQYSWSLFNAMSHMLCIGYGRFPPHNVTELWVTLCSMTIGATFYAVFIGIMSTLILSIDSSGRLYKEKLNQVGEYMRYRKLPIQTRRRVQDYYEHRFHHKWFDEEAILNELSYPLREEIQINNARSLLLSVPFFYNGGDDFIRHCVTMLKFQVFLPGEFVCKRGQKGDKMYFIVRGIVDVLTNDGYVATSLTDGSHFGEISLLNQHNRRVACCRAATMLDLYSLTAKDFRYVLDEFPEMQDALEDVAAERLTLLDKYSEDARRNKVKRDYKTEKVTSIENKETEQGKKRLSALNKQTLTKGFFTTMSTGLVASLDDGVEKVRKSSSRQPRQDLETITDDKELDTTENSTGQNDPKVSDTKDKNEGENELGCTDFEIRNTLAEF